LLCFLSRIVVGGVLPTLPKAIGSDLVAGPNAIGFGCQDMSKTLPKGANNIGSCCPARPKTLQNRVAFSCLATPIDLGSGWAARPNIPGSDCATISKDIIICIINITNYFLLIFKILLFIFKILLFFIIIKSINIKNSIICVINIIIFIIIKSINIKNIIIGVINNIIFTIIKSINIKNSIIRVINIIIFTIINSINIKNNIICVINTVEP